MSTRVVGLEELTTTAMEGRWNVVTNLEGIAVACRNSMAAFRVSSAVANSKAWTCSRLLAAPGIRVKLESMSSLRLAMVSCDMPTPRGKPEVDWGRRSLWRNSRRDSTGRKVGVKGERKSRKPEGEDGEANVVRRKKCRDTSMLRGDWWIACSVYRHHHLNGRKKELQQAITSQLCTTAHC